MPVKYSPFSPGLESGREGGGKLGGIGKMWPQPDDCVVWESILSYQLD